MPGIAHKNLTDPQLHEPKGASEADLNTVLFSNGDGTTKWEPVTIQKLSFIPGVVAKVPEPTLTPVQNVDYTGMSAETDGSVSDGITFTVVNKNVKELAVALQEANSTITELQNAVKAQTAALNSLIQTLKDSDFIQIAI